MGEDHLQTCPPELSDSDHSASFDGFRLDNPHLSCAQLPGTWGSATYTGMGADDQYRSNLFPHQLVDRDLPRFGHLHCRALFQPGGRWAKRDFGPKDEKKEDDLIRSEIMYNLKEQDLEDLILGCAILGTGGGGSPKRGLTLIQSDLKAGREFKLIGLEELPDAARIASPYMCGSVPPEEDVEDLFQDEGIECLKAFEALEEYIGQEFFAAIPTEIGGGNTAVALAVAAKRGIPIVDADPAGRSVPELQHTTFYIQNVPITPLAVATAKGDTAILTEVADDFRAEAIVRAIAVASGNRAGVADHPLEGRALKESVIPGTLSKALAIGEAVREARSSSTDPVEAAIIAGKGYLLFKGEVAQASWKIEEGFTIGELSISGEDDDLGHQYRVWYKNEHIISWFDNQSDVTVPDLICVLDPQTGVAITNPNCKEGMEVAVIGYPAPEMWRSSRGLELFGPSHFGYEIQYRPIEGNRRLR